jgi:hypothetical protein
MTGIQISEIIHALDLLGTVHLNKEKTKPNAAILKVRELISQGAGVTLSDWIERQKSPTKPAIKRSKKVNIDDDQLHKIVQSWNDIGLDEIRFDQSINELNEQGLTPKSWQRLSVEYAGKKASSGAMARQNIVEHFAASVRLAKRRSLLQNSG